MLQVAPLMFVDNRGKKSVVLNLKVSCTYKR